MSTLLVKNPMLIACMNDRGEELHNHQILINNGIIEAILENNLKVETDEIIDASNMVVLPGFINTHHHLFQSLTRNVPRMQNSPLFDWLRNHYEIWREINAEAVYISAQTALLELMKSGTSTSSDHLYLYPSGSEEFLIDQEIKAAIDLGIRFQPTRGSMSLGRKDGGLPPDDIVQTEEKIFQDIERVIATYHDSEEGAMLRISLAPCSPFSDTPEGLKRTVRFAEDHGLQIHTHLAETLDEENYCLQKYGLRPVEYMASLGWIRQNAWFAHAIHLNDNDIQLMSTARTGITHCPSSNLRLGSGIARIKELRQAGVAVGLGVDGSASNDSSNMLMEIRNAMMISRLREQENWLSAREVLYMATRGGAQVLGRDDIGQIKVGKQADLAVFSLRGIEYAGAWSDPLAALVYCVRMSPVDYLIIKGKIQISKGKSQIDENNLVTRHNKISKSLIEKAHKHTNIDFLSM